MVAMLFRPFEAGRWFALGFTAWLAQLGSNGASFNFNVDPDTEEGEAIIGLLVEFVREHAALAISIGVAILVALLVLGLVFLWLRCRGTFMFLDNSMRGTSFIRDPWHRFAGNGHSLFFWSLGFGILSLLAIALIVGGAYFLLEPTISSGARLAEAWPLLAAVVLVASAVVIVFSYVWMLTDSFVVPLMHKHGESTTASWRRFGALFRARPGPFILYGLFLFLLMLGVFVLVIAAGLTTCCCGFIILAIPYIGTVVLLPVWVTIRLFSVEFLKQFGSEFDADPAPPPLPAVEAA